MARYTSYKVHLPKPPNGCSKPVLKVNFEQTSARRECDAKTFDLEVPTDVDFVLRLYWSDRAGGVRASEKQIVRGDGPDVQTGLCRVTRATGERRPDAEPASTTTHDGAITAQTIGSLRRKVDALGTAGRLGVELDEGLKLEDMKAVLTAAIDEPDT